MHSAQVQEDKIESIWTHSHRVSPDIPFNGAFLQHCLCFNCTYVSPYLNSSSNHTFSSGKQLSLGQTISIVCENIIYPSFPVSYKGLCWKGCITPILFCNLLQTINEIKKAFLRICDYIFHLLYPVMAAVTLAFLLPILEMLLQYKERSQR